MKITQWQRVIEYVNNSGGAIKLGHAEEDLRETVNITLIGQYIHRLVRHGYVAVLAPGIYKRVKKIPRITIEGRVEN